MDVGSVWVCLGLFGTVSFCGFRFCCCSLLAFVSPFFLYHSSCLTSTITVVTSTKEGNSNAVDDDLLRDAGLLDEEVTTATAASNGEKQDENGTGNGEGRPVVAPDGSVLDMGKSAV